MTLTAVALERASEVTQIHTSSSEMRLESSVRKLNVGCGRRKIAGYEGADITDYGQEWVCDIRNLPMPDCTYDEVMAIHVIEHFASWDAPAAMNEWVRVLKPGGKLVIECPDMLRVCAMVLLEHTGATKLHPNLTFGGLWGDQQDGNEHMIHRWGYSPDTMKGLMEACGLDEVRTEAPQYHQPIRDMRVVGIKP